MNGQTRQATGLGIRALVAVLAVLRDTQPGKPANNRHDTSDRTRAGAGTPAPRPAWK